MLSYKDSIKESVYDYGSIQVNINPNISKKIKKFSDKIPDDDLYKKDGEYGIETDHHVTVRYGLDISDKNEIENFTDYYKDKIREIKIRFWKTSIFEADEYDVLKIDIESSDLKFLNKLLGDYFTFPGETHKDYKPHCTIAYMKRGKADKYIGDESFKNFTDDFYSIIFSSKDGNKYKIKL